MNKLLGGEGRGGEGVEMSELSSPWATIIVHKYFKGLFTRNEIQPITNIQFVIV